MFKRKEKKKNYILFILIGVIILIIIGIIIWLITSKPYKSEPYKSKHKPIPNNEFQKIVYDYFVGDRKIVIDKNNPIPIISKIYCKDVNYKDDGHGICDAYSDGLNYQFPRYEKYYNNAIQNIKQKMPDYNNQLTKKIIKKYGKIEDWNVSQVTDMSNSFSSLPPNCSYEIWDNYTTFWEQKESIYNGWDKVPWDITNDQYDDKIICKGPYVVTDSFDLSKWDVSQVTNMKGMFGKGIEPPLENTKWNLNMKGVTNWKGCKKRDEKTGNCISASFTLTGREQENCVIKENRYCVSKKYYNNIEYLSKNLWYDYNPDGLDKWNVSKVKDMSFMFHNLINLNKKGLDKWDVSKVEDMSFMFALTRSFDFFEDDLQTPNHIINTKYLKPFNKDISNWKVGNVKNMRGMFINNYFPITFLKNKKEIETASSISMWTISKSKSLKWDVSQVEDMSLMFSNTNFNGDISDWKVGNVKNMSMMFFGSEFNGDISDWKVGNVKNMSMMFFGSGFNNSKSPCEMSDLNRWDVRKVEDIRYIFGDIFTNNLNISNWKLDKVKKIGTYVKTDSQGDSLIFSEDSDIPQLIDLFFDTSCRSRKNLDNCVKKNPDNWCFFENKEDIRNHLYKNLPIKLLKLLKIDMKNYSTSSPISKKIN